MRENITQGRISISRDTIVAGLLHEANNFGENSSPANRLKAWELLARILGCFDGPTRGEGVRVFFDIQPERPTLPPRPIEAAADEREDS